MSVIQISKIQVRRGQKMLTGSVPQLSSAEFAWAVDTQELFIGNGSISEGAPYVGNTKILTEHDNILELVSSYRFGAQELSITGSVNRSLQNKLDETVSVIDFGAVPDGSTDCTAAFETAFTQLFKNTNSVFKKTLLVPNGTYLFLSDLKIPSDAIIRGENKSESILNIGNNNIIFVSSAGTLPGNFTSADHPINISVSNLTIAHDQGRTEITASKACHFNSVGWVSNYELGDTVFIPENANGVYNIPAVTTGGNITVSGDGVAGTVTQPFNVSFLATLIDTVNALNADLTFAQSFIASVAGTSLKIRAISTLTPASVISSKFYVSGQLNNILPSAQVLPILSEYTDGSTSVTPSVYWYNELFGTRTTDISFYHCDFNQSKVGIKCQQGAIFDTEIDIKDCKFFICDTGIYIGGVAGQGNHWRLDDCFFEEIAGHAIVSTNGQGTHISRSRFKKCGNGTGSAQFPITSIVRFAESANNVVTNCSSDRHQFSSVTSSPNVASVVEFENSSITSLVDRNFSTIYTSDSFTQLSILPAANRFIILDYFLSLGSNIKHSRIGKLTITISDDLGDINDIPNVAFSDNYSYSAAGVESEGGAMLTNFEFNVSLGNYDADSGVETIVLKYKNPITGGANGSIAYSITYGV